MARPTQIGRGAGKVGNLSTGVWSFYAGQFHFYQLLCNLMPNVPICSTRKVKRQHIVAAGRAPGEEKTCNVCVRTPYVFEYIKGSRPLMTAAEVSLLLLDIPSLQIEVPQGTPPVIQLDDGHSPFETIFLKGSSGETLQKEGTFKFLARKTLNGDRVVRASGLSHVYILAPARSPRANVRRT
jgi:hypothetical protein